MTEAWKVINLELSEGVPALSAESGIGGLYITFWWQGVPLGHQEIWASQLPMPATQVRELILTAITPAVGAHLFEHGFRAALPDTPVKDHPCDLSELMSMSQPLAALQKRQAEKAQREELAKRSVSLVICTRNRPQDLRRCLVSLRSLTRQPQQIIVVDNCPTDDTTQRLIESEDGIEYVLEPQPGLSRARNAGILKSRGDIVAFTDDDVVVHPDWIQGLLLGFDSPDVMAVTGPVLPAELQTEAQLLFQQGHDHFGWGYHRLTFDADFFRHTQRIGSPVWRIGAGANMAFQRKTFQLVGGFDERLGAGASGCSEDSELWYRVLAGGWLCRYEPTAVVHHYHRNDLDSLRHQMHQYMRGHMVALLIQFEKYRHWGNLNRAFNILPRYYARGLYKALRGSKRGARTLGAQICGCAAGVKYYWQHRHSRDTCRPSIYASIEDSK